MASRKRRARSRLGPVTAADVIEFIETVCFIPGGKFVGQPLRLAGLAEGHPQVGL